MLVHDYKGYTIAGVAIEAPEISGWKSQGVIYHAGSQVELKRFDAPKQIRFGTVESAEQWGISMCREWIDKHPGTSWLGRSRLT